MYKNRYIKEEDVEHILSYITRLSIETQREYKGIECIEKLLLLGYVGKYKDLTNDERFEAIISIQLGLYPPR